MVCACGMRVLHWCQCHWTRATGFNSKPARTSPALPGTMEHFLLACISWMSSERLRTTLSVGVDGRLLERKLQVELHTAALSVLPRGFNICPDVGKVMSVVVG